MLVESRRFRLAGQAATFAHARSLQSELAARDMGGETRLDQLAGVVYAVVVLGAQLAAEWEGRETCLGQLAGLFD